VGGESGGLGPVRDALGEPVRVAIAPELIHADSCVAHLGCGETENDRAGPRLGTDAHGARIERVAWSGVAAAWPAAVGSGVVEDQDDHGADDGADDARGL
jgi:hypothetical protein